MPTLFEKIWARHVVARREDGQSLLYVDRHLLHEGSAPAFALDISWFRLNSLKLQSL